MAAGCKPTAGLPVSATQGFTNEPPSFTQDDATVGQKGGYPTSSPTGLFCFGTWYTNPDPSPHRQDCGIYISSNLGANPGGKFYFVQLVDVSATRSGPGGTQTAGVPVGDPPTSYYTSGLDGLFPMNPSDTESPSLFPYFPTGLHYMFDGPWEPFDPPTTDWTTYSVTGESFQSYLMYCPTGTASMDVPYDMWSWSWSATGTYANAVWTAPDSPMTTPTKVSLPSHPVWSQRVHNVVYHFN